MTWIAHSRLVALVIGLWSAYCACTGSIDGTVTLLFCYAITVWSYGNKKDATNCGRDASNK